jgi:hypothetical protein
MVVHESIERGATVPFVFENVTNQTWQDILDHYREQQATFSGYYFDQVTLQPSRTKAGYWWKYTSIPTASDLHDDVRTVQVIVRMVPRVIQQTRGIILRGSSRIIPPIPGATRGPLLTGSGAIYPPTGGPLAGPTLEGSAEIFPPSITGVTLRGSSEIFPGIEYDPRTVLCVQFDGANNSEDFVNSANNGPALSITSGNNRPYITTTDSKFGQAGRFTPITTNYARLETDLNDGFNPGTSDFFIGLWVKNTGSWGGGFAFTIGSTSTSGGQYIQVLTNRIGFAMFGQSFVTSSVTDQFLNTWVNCVVDRKGGSVRAFISTNGTSFTQVGSTVTVSDYTVNSTFRFATIGSSRSGGPDSFPGLLDSVLVARRSFWDGTAMQSPLSTPYVP